ncbi:Arylsulfatase B [Hypsibius exemplaris]|uniref:Arylsulfatase B n=1 Tax=Hypsibius exemplaris TaxID=2072580 RepID=A0A1W0WNB9_HYPEX|nr:Arylsulfatase B [Hypsibius exemplaris]
MEGGYGWVVVFATFLINAIVQGVVASCGILLNVLLDQFKEGKAITGWIPSLLGGLLLAVGPFSSYLISRSSCRSVTVLGGFIAVIGCLISSLATSVRFLIFSYGIVTGFGFGLLYLPQTIIVAEWFKETRSTATGIGLSGAGFGAFIIPPISQYILKEYGWSQYFVLSSVLVSGCCGLGLLLRPNPEINALMEKSAGIPQPAPLIASHFLRDPAFIIYCVSTGLFSGSYRIPFSFLPDYAVRQLSSSKDQAAYLLSYLGIASFLGRLLGGVVGDRQRHRRFLVFLILIVLSGVSVVAMGFADSYTTLAVCSLGYGAASGGRVALNSIILADIFGLPALTQTFGLVCLVQGISIFFGTPVAGWLADLFGDYRTSFILFGTGMMCCSSVLTMIPVARRSTISGYGERKVSWILRILPCLVIPFLLGGAPTVKSLQTPVLKPNIIFIFADDMGWNDVGFHGYNEIRTPNIDRLASEGVILNGYYTQYMCTPSRSALMTGKYPIRTGLQHYVLRIAEPRGLPLTEKIMPQYLDEAGYKSHMIGKWHLGYSQKQMTPTLRGFESFFGYYTGQNDYFNYTPTAGVGAQGEYLAFDLWDNLQPARNSIGRYATELFTEKAVGIINSHNYKDPLFLYLSHLAPHYANAYDPVQAPQKYIDRFPGIANEGRRKYAATVSALDDSVGQVMDALKVKGVAGNTVIVFSSDNGGAGAEQGIEFGPPSTFASNWPLRGAKSSQWEGGLRTTAALWSPLLELKGRVSTELYHISDWLPTFIRLAGGSPIDNLDGYDIWDSISKGLPSPRKEILHQIDPVWGEYALRWNQYKLISGSHANAAGYRIDKWYDPEGGFHANYVVPNAPGALACADKKTAEIVACDAVAMPCLFDIEMDPCEYWNIAAERTDIVDYMMDLIRAFNETALPSNNLPQDPRAAAGLNNGLVQPWLE